MADEPKTIADELDALARRVAILDHATQRDPERFHAEKSDIVHRLRAIARRERGVVRRQPNTTWRPPAGYRDV